MPPVAAGLAAIGGTILGASATAALGTAFGASIAGGILIGIGTAVVGGLAYGTYLLTPKMPDMGEVDGAGRKNMFRDAVAHREVIYGQIRKSGVVAFAETSNFSGGKLSQTFSSSHAGYGGVEGDISGASANQDRNNLLHLIILLADHEVKEIGDIYFDEKLSASSEFEETYRINKHIGTDDQVADPDLVAALPTLWTSAHRLRGIAYIYVRLRSGAYGGQIPRISCMVKGKKVYDPRTEDSIEGITRLGGNPVKIALTAHSFSDGDEVMFLNVGGTTELNGNRYIVENSAANTIDLADTVSSGFSAWTSGGTVGLVDWSDNWALCTADYLTDDIGFEVSAADEINWDSVTAAANVADEDIYVTPPVNISTSSQKQETGLEILTRVVPRSGREYQLYDQQWESFISVADASLYVVGETVTVSASSKALFNTTWTVLSKDDEKNRLYIGTWSYSPGDASGATVTADAPRLNFAADHYIDHGETIEVSVAHTVAAYRGEQVVDYIDSTTLALRNVSYTSAGTGGTGGRVQKRNTCNGLISSNTAPASILKEILRGAAGKAVYTQGKFVIHPGAYSPVVRDAITVDDLRGPMQIGTKHPRGSLFNTVKGTYVDPAQNWDTAEYGEITNSTYVTEDGMSLPTEQDFHFVVNQYEAQRAAQILLKQHRQQITVNFPGKFTLVDVAVGETVSLTVDYMGWDEKEFKVEEWELSDEGVDLVLREEASASYDWTDTDAVLRDSAPNTNLSSPWDMDPPTSLTYSYDVSEGVGFLPTLLTKIGWTAPDEIVAGYELQWKVASEGTITGITQADPAVVTSTAHPFSNGDVVNITGVVGMVEVNGRNFTVANKAADTFELSGVDSTGYTLYSSGGTVSDTEWTSVTGITGTNYTIPGLANATYDIRVRATNNIHLASQWLTGQFAITEEITAGAYAKDHLVVGDNSSAGEYSTVQLAVAGLSTKGFEKIYIRNGTYTVLDSSEITLPQQNITIVGESEGGVIINADPSGGTNPEFIFKIEGHASTDYIYRFSNLSLTSTCSTGLTGTDHILIDCQDASGTERAIVKVDNVTIDCYEKDYGVRYRHYSYDEEGAVVVTNSEIKGGGYALYVEGLKNLNVTGCKFSDTKLVVIETLDVTNHIIKDNIILEFKSTGLNLLSDVKSSVTANITGNKLTVSSSVTPSGSSFSGMRVAIDRAIISNNYIDINNDSTTDTSLGIKVSSSDYPTVGNNIIKIESADTETFYGIWLSAEVYNGTISGNSIKIDGPSSGSASRYGIYLNDSDRNVITGNIIDMTNAYSTYDVGVYLFATHADYNSITANTLRKCSSTYEIDDNGTGNQTTPNLLVSV